MILPLLPFLMAIEPELVRTDSAPSVITFAQGTSDEVQFESCFDRVRSTEIGFDGYRGEKSISVVFGEEAQKEFAQLTAKFVGTQAPITFERDIIVSPFIHEPIVGGSVMITGFDTVAELERIEEAARGRCTQP